MKNQPNEQDQKGKDPQQKEWLLMTGAQKFKIKNTPKTGETIHENKKGQ